MFFFIHCIPLLPSLPLPAIFKVCIVIKIKETIYYPIYFCWFLIHDKVNISMQPQSQRFEHNVLRRNTRRGEGNRCILPKSQPKEILDFPLACIPTNKKNDRSQVASSKLASCDLIDRLLKGHSLHRNDTTDNALMPIRFPITNLNSKQQQQQPKATGSIQHAIDPFIYAYSPPNPSMMDWTRHYPEFYPAKEGQVQKKVEFADIGCGYGGLLIALAPLFPDTLMLGKCEGKQKDG